MKLIEQIDRQPEPPPCKTCEGRGWVGACHGGNFPFIGKLAMDGRLPTKPCPDCAPEAAPLPGL